MISKLVIVDHCSTWSRKDQAGHINPSDPHKPSLPFRPCGPDEADLNLGAGKAWNLGLASKRATGDLSWNQ